MVDVPGVKGRSERERSDDVMVWMVLLCNTNVVEEVVEEVVLEVVEDVDDLLDFEIDVDVDDKIVAAGRNKCRDPCSDIWIACTWSHWMVGVGNLISFGADVVVVLEVVEEEKLLTYEFEMAFCWIFFFEDVVGLIDVARRSVSPGW